MGFDQVHPSCPVVTCCVIKRGLQVCAECQEYPCEVFSRPATLRDSFVTHQRMAANQEAIQRFGLAAFVLAQGERLTMLEEMLGWFDDGRSKSFYCLAAALLSVDGLHRAIDTAGDDGDVKARAKSLRAVLEAQAVDEEVALELRDDRPTARDSE